MPCIKKKLTAKQASFIEYFANPNSSTFNNIQGSMLRAGYAESFARHRASYMLSNVVISAANDAYRAKNNKKYELTIAEVLKDLEYGLKLAKERKPPDLNAIARFSELRGKTLAMFTDKVLQQGDGLKLNFTTQEPKPGPKLADTA